MQRNHGNILHKDGIGYHTDFMHLQYDKQRFQETKAYN
jgi:hypothetical protein